MTEEARMPDQSKTAHIGTITERVQQARATVEPW
jgi:hypothetical protein